MQPTALGVYIFAGGFTLGVRQHFNVLAHLEDGDFGVPTSKRNLPDIDVFTNPETWPLEKFEGVQFVYGNPPCAPWSNSARSWKKSQAGIKEMSRYETDPRTSCVYTMFSTLEKLRPRAWAWESVPGAFSKGRPLVDSLTERANALGYSATYVFENALHLGVPQKRRRFFCIFHDVEIPWTYEHQPLRTVWNAIGGWSMEKAGDVYPIKGATQELLKHVKPGTGLKGTWNKLHPEPHELNERGHVKGRPTFSSLRLSYDRPASTMIGGAHQFHPEHDRMITVKEAQVLCGYPYEFEFVGRIGHCYPQMAKAVLPPVGKWLAENVSRALAANIPAARKTILMDFDRDRQEILCESF
jgi:DNA (cytosine-5)-methyltransferase 1